jgi:hypothetical protein
MHLVKVFCQL